MTYIHLVLSARTLIWNGRTVQVWLGDGVHIPHTRMGIGMGMGKWVSTVTMTVTATAAAVIVTTVIVITDTVDAVIVVVADTRLVAIHTGAVVDNS